MSSGALQVVCAKYHRPGKPPTGPEVRTTLRTIAQYLKRLPNHENDDGMGYSGLILPNLSYAAKSDNGAAYVEPPDPPMVPALAGLTAEQRAVATYTNQQQWKHKGERDLAKSNALQLLLSAGDADTYLRAFWDEDVGYDPEDLHAMATHLRQTYDTMGEDERISHKQQLAGFEYTGGQVEPVINAIVAAAEARPAAHPMTDYDKCDTMYEKMHTYEPMRRACRNWRHEADANKTWDNCKEHFIEAAKDIAADATTGTLGLQAHMATTDITNALKDSSKALNDSKTALDANRLQLANLARQSDNQEDIIADLRRQLADKTNNRGGRGGRGGRRGGRGGRGERGGSRPRIPGPEAPGKYCWTHGYDAECSSSTCADPAPGHKPRATKRNTMGGKETFFRT